MKKWRSNPHAPFGNWGLFAAVLFVPMLTYVAVLLIVGAKR